MKIDLSTIDTENFVLRETEIAGETCYLVFPKHVGCKWTKDNLIFRSSVWNSEGELISASFKKFFNWGEQPDLTYTPSDLKAKGGCQIMEKLDGSTLIVSRYNGQTIIRTRGTTDATILDNGHEIALLRKKYSKFFDMFESVKTQLVSVIFEWESPENRIVIKHDELDMKLTAIINHENYTMFYQSDLDKYAEIHALKRPRVFNFNTIEEMKNAVEAFKGIEGVCVYCNNGQDIRKLKGVEYLAKHRLKDELGNFDRVVDYYFTHGCPNYNDFYQSVVDTIDWETAEEIRGDISNIIDGMKEVELIRQHMLQFANNLKSVSRKEAAEKIIQAYGKTNRASFVFRLLDAKELDEKDLKKLLYQVLKK